MKLLYFAWVRKNLGVSEELVDVPSEINDVRGLIAVSYTHLTLPTSG